MKNSRLSTWRMLLCLGFAGLLVATAAGCGWLFGSPAERPQKAKETPGQGAPAPAPGMGVQPAGKATGGGTATGPSPASGTAPAGPRTNPPAGETPEIVPKPAADQKTVTLYFADFQAQFVVPEEREVSLTGSKTLPEAVMEEILAGPRDPYLTSPIPKGTRLLSLEVNNGIAYVNLSRFMVGGTAGESMVINSIVNSMVELQGIEKVQILIEGKASDTVGGHVILEEPIGRGPILAYPIFIDEQRVQWLQQRADDGVETWRKDPMEVARRDGRMLRFTLDTVYQELSRKDGVVILETTADGKSYRLELRQPVRQSDGGIWIINNIEELS
ncbi:MAG: GerMN domain-containing protein [Firmicutes bacterium]|nr:GerMN domain-containing protein [Bacillota bacterium]